MHNYVQEEELEGTDMPEQSLLDGHGNSRTDLDSRADGNGSNVQRSRASLYEPEDGPSTSESSAAATVTAVPSVSPLPTGPAGAARKQSSKAASSGATSLIGNVSEGAVTGEAFEYSVTARPVSNIGNRSMFKMQTAFWRRCLFRLL